MDCLVGDATIAGMTDYERIAKVIAYLSENHRDQPSLDELAALVDLSPHHFQRLFNSWAGVSPKKFVQCLTAKAAKDRLRAGASVLQASLDSGLSGPGRLHELTVSLDAASPGEIKAGGRGWNIDVGVAKTPFGNCVLAESPRGICFLAFVDDTDQDAATDQVHADWPNATIQWNPAMATQRATEIFNHTHSQSGKQSLRCFVKGTTFQLRVWKALLEIPLGGLATYGEIANQIGNEKATRAVGTAVGRNRIGYLIPCHRVIRETGVIGQYRWGHIRKKAMVACELAQES